MMILRTISLFSAGILLLLSSCSPEHSQIVLAKYGDNEIKMNEFERAYAKNAGGYEKAKSDSLNKLRNFLDLYVNFKMKLRDAEVRGYDKDPSLLNELNDYKERIGVTYLLEKKIVEPGLKNLYERRKWEYRVSHIMIRTSAGKVDDAKALATTIFDSIKNGADYEEVAKRNSQDQFSAPSGGDLFYLTAGVLPVEFEDAVYKTEVGQIYPDLVQTRYGFHIIKVTDKRERIPAVHASHILINFANDSGTPDTAAARATADSLLARIRSGEDFAKLASEYSEDPASKPRGGDLGYFERRQMVKEFEEAAFNLQPGQVSDVIKTGYGFHIIKMIDKQPYPAFEEDRENLKKMFERQSYQMKRNEFIDSLRAKFNYSVNDENIKFILENSDSVKLDGEHPKLPDFKDKPVFTLADKSVTAGELFDKVVDKKDYYKKIISEYILNGAINSVGEDYLLKEEALRLEKTDPEFAGLMNDYRNGIFIFKLQEDEVWNKIEIDSVKLYDYYLSNKDKYNWPDRVSFAEIFSTKDSLINKYYSMLKEGADFDSLASGYTERTAMKDKNGVYQLNNVKTSVLYEEANKLNNPGDYSAPFKVSGGWSIVKLIEKDMARPKTFEEARAEVSSAFQENETKRLENEYLEKLKKRYEPEIYYSELTQAFAEK